MKLRALKTAALVLASVAGMTAISAGPAAAVVTVTFSFNNMSGSNSQGQQSSAIAAYMTSVLSGYYAGSTVNVSGAIGQQGSSAYAGEGYVVGPKVGSTVTPYTLANTDGGVYNGSSNDGFIKNCTGTECSAGSSPDIYINFNGHRISSFSFDFEIFPDGTCTKLDGAGSACGGAGDPNTPDLEINSGDGATGTHFDTLYGVTPSGANKYSINDPGGELAPQLLGHASYTVAAGANITTLDFMDWPETIGIDKLTVTFIPEASTLAFLAFGVMGLAWMTRRKHTGWAQSLRSSKQS